MFTYRLHLEDGSDVGEAVYAMMIKPGEGIHLDAGRRFRVVEFDEEDESPVGRAATGRSRIGRSRRGDVAERAPKAV